MFILSNILIGIIAFLHFYIMILEMFFWDKPKGMKAFDVEEDFAKQTTVMAANQGLYNGFIAAGLVLSIISSLFLLKIFFLGCVFIAGIYGSLTFNKKIVFIQSIPSLITLIVVILSMLL